MMILLHLQYLKFLKKISNKEAFKILENYYKPGEFNEGRQKMVWMPEDAG